MKKWMTNIIQPNTVDATDQAKSDIAKIAKTMGYELANIYRYDDSGESEQAKQARIDGITAAVAAGDLLVYQYPSLNSGRFDDLFLDMMHARHVKVACLVHDVVYLRDQTPPTWIDEIAYFNRCDVLIVHNRRMAAALTKLGVITPMVDQLFLDYLDTNHDSRRYVSDMQDFKRGVVLAGNILKSRYLVDWAQQTPITVFGYADKPLVQQLKANVQVDYRGARLRWDLIQELPRTFGLAWDSPDNQHRYDDYTRFNHPHKVSLYLAHGLPVIIWRQAALADLIVKNHLGLAIDNLVQLDTAIAQISDADLATMIAHVNQFGQLLRDGWFTRQGLQAAEQILLAPDFHQDEVVK